MSVQNPRALILLFVVIPVIFLQIRAYIKGSGEIARLAAQWPADAVARVYLVKSFFAALGQVVFVVFAVLALADITIGEEPIEEDRSGVDVAFVVDFSRSMLADDASPTRLGAAVSIVQSLARDIDSARFALVGFKGRGVTVVPLTEDLNAVDRIANALGPDLIVAPGTNLEEGIREGLRALPHETFANRVIVLLSDGESLEGDTDAALAALRTQGVPLFSVGLGSPAGATVPDTDGTPLQDDAGRPVVSRADFDALRTVAEQSGGSFIAAEAGGAAREVQRRIAAVSLIRESEGFRLVPRRRFRFFAVIALLGLAVSVGVRVVRWRSMF